MTRTATPRHRVTGCSGTLPTDEDDVSHGGNVFGVVSATYTDHGDSTRRANTLTHDRSDSRSARRSRRSEVAVNQSGTNVAATT